MKALAPSSASFLRRRLTWRGDRPNARAASSTDHLPAPTSLTTRKRISSLRFNVTGPFLFMNGQHHDPAPEDKFTDQLGRTESQTIYSGPIRP